MSYFDDGGAGAKPVTEMLTGLGLTQGYASLQARSTMNQPCNSDDAKAFVEGDCSGSNTGTFIEPRTVSSVPTSQTGITPWVSISQTSSQTACSGLGSKYHLFTNPEWMTLATNIASVDSNWSGGTVGNGMLRRGHSDINPPSVCAANPDDANAYVETDCTGLNTGTFSQRRTAILTTGGVLWDIGGNVLQWVDRYNNIDKPTGGMNWIEFTATTPSTNWPWITLTPRNETHSFWSDSWNSNQGIGQIYPGTAGSGGALLRGGFLNDGVGNGPFGVYLNSATSSSSPSDSLRCTWQP